MKASKPGLNSQADDQQAESNPGVPLNLEQLDQAAGGMTLSLANFAGKAAKSVTEAVANAVAESQK